MEVSDDKAAFDDMFYSSDYSGYNSLGPDWRDSSVLRVHSCLELKIQLGLG